LAYLKFDISTIGAINNATLRLFGRLSSSVAAPVPVTVLSSNNTSWSENSITWNNKPSVNSTVLAQQSIGGDIGVWYDFDLTSFLQQQQAAGATLVTLVLKNVGGNSSYTIFNSDESSSNRPQIVVSSGAPAIPQQALVVSANSINVPEQGSTTFNVKLAVQPSSNLTVNITKQSGGDPDLTSNVSQLVFTSANWNVAQVVRISDGNDSDTIDGSATFSISANNVPTQNVVATEIDNDSTGVVVTEGALADAFVRDGSNANKNFGSAAELDVKKSSSGYNRETYLRFDLSSVSTITSATLRLFGKLSQNASAVVTQVFGSGDTTWSESSITWNNRPATNTSALASQTVSGTTATWYEFDLTSYLQQLKSTGATSVTLVLRNASGNSSYTIFNSKESATNAPQLVIAT
jgi:hypothetical protein